MSNQTPTINNYYRTAAWLIACGKHPSPANLSVQIGCHLEEIVEFLECLETDCAAAIRALKEQT